MANVTITQLPNAGAITGTELVPIVQNGVTVHTTTSALAGSPVQTQTFLTLNNEPTLNNSRSLGVSSGLSLTDGGAQGALTINLSGAVSNFNGLGTGVVVKTGTSTLAARTFTTSGLGLSMADGDGVAGNPTLQLTGIAAAIASSSGTGMLAIVGGLTIANRAITGTANQIDVADGNGAANPTISLTSNPIVPGLAGITIPVGATADRSISAGVGTIRYNTSMGVFEGYTGTGWGVIVAGAAITTFSAGATGLTPSAPSTGAVVLGGTLLTTSGGTGLATYTAGDLPYYASGTALSKLAIGTSGYVLQSNGSAPVWVAASTVVGGAAGSNTQVQYNGSGVLAASANLTFNGTILTSTGFAGPLNGTVGATTANTGAFTTLSTTGAVTITGGTANGVAYLNSSKVLTTGTALVFDGTNLGVGTTSPTVKLHVVGTSIVGAAGTPGFTSYKSTGVPDGFDVGLLGGDASANGFIYNRNNGAVVFGTNNAERMRIDASGNLGIGTTSPGGNSVNRVVKAYGSTSSSVQAQSSVTTISMGAGSGEGYVEVTGAYPLEFIVNGSERARLDASGNLGLGVTPSALWFTGAKVINVGATGALWSNGSNNNCFSSNAIFQNASTTYVNTSQATQYQQFNGTHAWYTAPSGTAGAAITFTQAMTLDSSGNLGVGVTNPIDKLQVNGGITFGSDTVTTARSRIFESFGLNIEAGAAGGGRPIIFGTNNTERARLDASGNLLVGTTTQPSGVASARVGIVSASSDYPLGINNTNASPYGIYQKYTAATPNGTGNQFFYFQDATAVRAYMQSNGGLANYSANNTNLSDRREKTNFTLAGNYLAKICAIPVQTYNYIDQNLEEDAGLTLGVVAQDVQMVAPELVTESNWGTEETPKMRLSIYQTDLQYALMKCIQEQQALIESLTQRLTALESK